MNTLYITESMMSESSLWEVKGLHNSGKTQGQKDLQMRTDAAGLMTIYRGKPKNKVSEGRGRL